MSDYDIKLGDIVKVKRETPSDIYNNLPYDMPFFVAEIERDLDNHMNDTFILRNYKTCLNIHPHWLEKWDAKQQSKDNTITTHVKTDFGEDVGFALLDRALELQKNYTELEGEIKRLYELVNGAKNGLNSLRLTFDNSFLGRIARMVCCDFRPLSDEEKVQFRIDIKNMANNLKKQELIKE